MARSIEFTIEALPTAAEARQMTQARLPSLEWVIARAVRDALYEVGRDVGARSPAVFEVIVCLDEARSAIPEEVQVARSKLAAIGYDTAITDEGRALTISWRAPRPPRGT